jgi:SAM-dependent methyltransferase
VAARAWQREAEALIAGALGGPPEVTIEAGAAAGGPLPFRDGEAARAVLSFVGCAPAPAARRALLAEAGRVLAPGGALAVVDHNRPRRRLAALAALAGPPRVPGRSPAARWRRLAYPTAREVQAAGLGVECLRLAARERVQVVVARRAGPAGPQPAGGPRTAPTTGRSACPAPR